MGLLGNGNLQTIYTKAYKEGAESEREYQFNDIMRLMHVYRVAYCIADYGHGFEINQRLKHALGERFDCMYYSHNLGVKLKYDKNKYMWVANRTQVIHDYITECKNGKHTWPGNEKESLQVLYEHHLAEQAEYKSTRARPGANLMITRSEELYYTHPTTQPDDGMHSCVYCTMAARIKPSGAGGMQFGGAYSR